MGTTPNGIVYPDDSSPIANLQDHLQQMAESVDVALGGTWASFTPALAGITLGNGTLSGRFSKSGKLIAYHVQLVGGTTTTGSGTITIGLPVTAAGSSNQTVGVRYFNASALYTGWADIAPSGTNARPYIANGTNGAMNALASFGNTHSLFVYGTYESA